MRLPDVLPDELLFSRLIRYCCLYAVPIPEFLNSVYEDDRASINPILTAGLSSISSIFRESQDNLLREQTLAPLFMHYYPHYKEKLTAAMISTDNYTAIRLSQLSCVREHEELTLKMCPMCVQEDIRQFGVAYWHRSHQIPGIESCHDHLQQLVHVSLPQRYRVAIGLPSLYLEVESPDSNYQSFLLARFAKQVLLEQSKIISTISPVSYKEKLADLGYVTKAGRLRRIKLLSDFYRFTNQLQYPSANLLPTSESDYKYVTNLLYNQYSQHIFKYLILGYWLSWQKVIRKEPVAKYEQVEQSLQHIEQQCVSLLHQGLSVSEISKKTGKSRTYITSVAYSAGMAHLFEPTKLKSSIRAEIIALAWKGFHRVEIARRASVSTGSVEMLISSVNGLVEWRKQCKHESKRRRYKCQILRYRQNTPLKIRKDIKRDCNAAFYWLYLHEPEWLESVLPKPSQPHPNPRTKQK
ncbi:MULTISPECIES: TnsD family Tn7-like transposition protein [Vibrio harveyi group]|uniref:TnsD family Tn7-like transposition protein n=1 Tax=Vibrio harveyi group TaxID=717610 RepID=UPI001C05FB57|nr:MULTISPECIES: TnsD family Tn7-like transposition protein [Vibrio harveyi group]MCR9365233.1 TnsD family transposase [Vibrio antiquarius]